MLPPKHRGDMRQRATFPQAAMGKPSSSSATTLPQVPPSSTSPSRSRLNTPYQASKALSLEPLSTTHMSPARNAQLPNYDTPLFLPSRGFGTQPIEPLRVTPRWPAPIDPIGGKRRLRVHNLNFEDFVEAFVRVALVVPNPGPRDLTEIGVRSALEWYEVMTSPATDADLWSDFCEAHCHGTEAFDVAAVVRERDPKGTELAARLTLLCDWLAKRMKELGIAGGGAGGSRKSKRGS